MKRTSLILLVGVVGCLGMDALCQVQIGPKEPLINKDSFAKALTLPQTPQHYSASINWNDPVFRSLVEQPFQAPVRPAGHVDLGFILRKLRLKESEAWWVPKFSTAKGRGIAMRFHFW